MLREESGGSADALQAKDAKSSGSTLYSPACLVEEGQRGKARASRNVAILS